MRVFRRLEKIVGTPEGRLLLVYVFELNSMQNRCWFCLRTVTD